MGKFIRNGSKLKLLVHFLQKFNGISFLKLKKSQKTQFFGKINSPSRREKCETTSLYLKDNSTYHSILFYCDFTFYNPRQNSIHVHARISKIYDLSTSFNTCVQLIIHRSLASYYHVHRAGFMGFNRCVPAAKYC